MLWMTRDGIWGLGGFLVPVGDTCLLWVDDDNNSVYSRWNALPPHFLVPALLPSSTLPSAQHTNPSNHVVSH